MPGFRSMRAMFSAKEMKVMKALKDKSRVGMIDDEIQNNTAMNLYEQAKL